MGRGEVEVLVIVELEALPVVVRVEAASKFAACLSSSFVMDVFSLTVLLSLTQLERARRQGHILRANSQEAADADDVRVDLAGLVEQDVRYVADFLVVGPEHVRALEFRGQQLIALCAVTTLAAVLPLVVALG